MYYTGFRIRNFKGIRDTTIKLSRRSKTGVFAFVGLNESGKTTILEAIHSFKPDNATSELLGGESGVPIKNRVPRHKFSNFMGDVSVTASVRVEDSEKSKIIDELKTEYGIIIRSNTFDDDIIFEKQQKFENGDFVENSFILKNELKIRTTEEESWRDASPSESECVKFLVYDHAPDIAYFPTFVFSFPEQIFLTEDRGNKVSKFYRAVFQDILDFDEQGHTIENSIIRRVRSEDKITSWEIFWNIWLKADDKDKIQHVIDRASSAVTKVVFGRWDKIFGENVKEKQINILFNVLQGERRDENGLVQYTNEHDIYIKFEIKDGTDRFDVNNRSLGFRWFFAFMLFTQFRVARKKSGPILFLFDEPASNLHAAAQQKLIESFPEIAKDSNMMAYTTHSHYMIDPKWLEQTFIVTNRADTPDSLKPNDSVIDAVSLSDESLDINVTPYRSFVNKYPNPDQTSYFQPILDRLQVVPSHFDIKKNSIVLEGKSDYYILKYAAKLLGIESPHLIPGGQGAYAFGSLILLSIGWNLNMLFLLDGDSTGKNAQDVYVRDHDLDRDRVITLDELVDGVKEIEGLFDEEALTIISDNLKLNGKTPTKKQISRYCQESWANNKVIPLGKGFESKAKELLDELEKRIPKS